MPRLRKPRDPWDTQFPEPIKVRGRTITTLSDARAFILRMREERQGHINWQVAAARLWEAGNDPTEGRVLLASEAFQVALVVTFMHLKD